MAERPKARATASSPERLHRTADVPQANKLENVRQLAAAARDGVRDAAALRQLLDLDPRHLAYYRRAAIILDMVEESRPGLAVTARGRELLATAEGSTDERACFLRAIRDARALKPFASFFLGDELPVEKVASRLEALTGLSPSTALRRAATLVQWRKYVLAPATSTDDGPSLPDLATEIEARVRRHNALAKQEVRAWLEKMEPRAFEELVASLCRNMGWVDVKVEGGSGDGGVDISAARLSPSQHKEPIAIQVKRYRHPVGPRIVRELIGALGNGRFVKGFLVTTSEFTAQSQKAAASDVRIELVRGVDLVELLAKHSVTLRYGAHGEIVRAT